MKKFKKITASIIAFSMLMVGVAGCGNKDDDSDLTSTGANSNGNSADPISTVSLKVWGSQDEQTILEEMIDSFKKANPDKKYNIQLGVVSEADANKRYLEDPDAAADVFAFASDQIQDLVNAGALYPITRNKDEIVKANSSGSIEEATVDGELYAYPMTADNGYFLYYDKSVLSEDDVKTLDTILKVSDEAGKKVFMDISNGWYNSSFFLAKGNLSLEDGKQVCDFNNEIGVKAGEAIKEFTAHNAFIGGEDPVFTGEIGNAIAAGVSGTWNAEAVKSKLGDNYAATKLPTFTLDGEQVQMSSFAGYKLVGVSSQTKHPADAMDFAEWISNEENQKKRFEAREIGPSNLNVANSPEVQENEALSALGEQNKFAKSQKDVKKGFWDPMEAFGATMESKDYSKSIQELLDKMVEQIEQ